MDGHSLTVYKFIPQDGAGIATRPTPSLPTPISSPPALPASDAVQARKLIASSVGKDGWKTLSIPGPQVVAFGMFTSKAYTHTLRVMYPKPAMHFRFIEMLCLQESTPVSRISCCEPSLWER